MSAAAALQSRFAAFGAAAQDAGMVLARAVAIFGRLRRPAAGKPASRAEEAARVRELAMRYTHTDPGFASDLIAAADRHEAGA